MSETELTKLAHRYLVLRTEKFKRQGELKAIEENLDQTEHEIAEFLGQDRTRFDYRGNLLYKQINAYPRQLPGKEFDLFGWLDRKNEGGIAKRAIHFKTLRKWYRENVTGTDKVKPSHPEWEEELTNFLETYEEININVRGEDQDAQRAEAYEAYKAELNGKAD